jgi:hypothetical protein
MLLKATLEFPTIDLAKEFAKAWGRATLTGNDQSGVRQDGSVAVTVYDIDNSKKEWIDSYVSSLNSREW